MFQITGDELSEIIFGLRPALFPQSGCLPGILYQFTKDFKTHERRCQWTHSAAKTPQARPVCLPLLPEGIYILLAVPLRIQYLPTLHGRKCVGHVMQCDHLAVPGLWGPERTR